MARWARTGGRAAAVRQPSLPLPLLLLVLLVSAGTVSAVKLKFRGQECMTYDLVMYHGIYGGFVAMPDAANRVAAYDLVITAPSNTRVHETKNAKDMKFNIVPYESGRYRFCLSETPGSRMLPAMRDVMWELHTTNTAADEHDGVKEQHTGALWMYISQIDQQLQQLRSTQQYLYWRERRHRETVDSVQARVLYFAVARSAVLACVSIGQVLFIRSLFSR
mmetsp:Transcript_15667/g.46247  ORF Transcript_15667/g.46247 Transcript_15667/m.46247 type:complete len:220 (-) Transcript_15667:1214-1873(-)